MTARVVCKYGALKGFEFPLSKHEPVLIGRAKTNQIVLDIRVISAQHARIFWDQARACYKVEDLGSTNGTFVDGTQLRSAEELGHLHMLNVGGAQDFFFIDEDRMPTCLGGRSPANDVAKSYHTMQGAVIAPLLVQTPSILASQAESSVTRTLSGVPFPLLPPNLAAWTKPAREKKVYLVLTHHTKEWAVALAEGENILGRNQGLHLRVDHEDISRQHARFILQDGKVYIEDLRSTNHSFINGHAVKGRVLVAPGAQLAFGRVKGYLEEREVGAADG